MKRQWSRKFGELGHRWGIEDGGEIAFIDLGDAALVLPGGMARAKAELKGVFALWAPRVRDLDVHLELTNPWLSIVQVNPQAPGDFESHRSNWGDEALTTAEWSLRRLTNLAVPNSLIG